MAHVRDVASYLGMLAVALDGIDRPAADRLVRFFEDVRGRDGIVHVAGDGGSAALASHMACDFVKLTELGVAPPVRSLAENPALLTMIANDLGFDLVFERQLRSFARSRDGLIVVSGSGRSRNLIAAATYAKRVGIAAFGLLGFVTGGPLRQSVDDALVVASEDYRIIEDLHHSVAHAVAASLAARAEASTKRVAVLDRDGVLGVAPREGEYVPSAEAFSWLPGARDAVVALKQAGWCVIVTTNQRGVALGKVTAESVDGIHRRMNDELRALGVTIDGFYVCPHDHDDGCSCRKPGLGMLRSAAERFGFTFNDCVVIGDSEVDAVMGRRAGCRTIVVGPRRAPHTESVADLARAVHLLLKQG